MTNGTTGQIDYQSTNAAQVINDAIGNLTQGGNILIKAGTYSNISAPITDHGKNSITLTGEKGAQLVESAGINAPLIYLQGVNNWIISGLKLQGQRLSQSVPGDLLQCQSGIMLWDCINPTIENCYIHDFRVHGIWTVGSHSSPITSYGGSIHDNVITNCDWNGITIGGSGGETSGMSVYSNDVSGSSDVGITTYGEHNMIYDNNVSSCLSTYGRGGANSGDGIDVEKGTYNTISNNIVTNCNNSYCAYYEGPSVGPVSFNTFADDTSINSTDNAGAFVLNAPNNYIQGGTVINWNTRAVWISGASNCVVQNLEITRTISDAGWNVGISLDSQLSYNVTLSNNIIIDQTGTVREGIYIDTTGVFPNIQGNTITGVQTGIAIYGNNSIIQNNRITSCTTTNGIVIESGTYYCQIQGNTLVSDQIIDDGTGAIISDPTMNPANLGNLSILGDPITVIVNQAVSAGSLLFLNSTGYFLASATNSSTMPVVAMAIQSASANANCQVITSGYMRDDAWSSWTTGTANTLYASTSAGLMTQTYPSTSGNIVQQVGTAIASNIVNFNNSGTWLTIS
jgi:hypothetical protein